jgi:hypothetical protein
VKLDGDTCARHLGQPFVTCIGNHIEQFLNPVASNPCDDAKLGKMRADRVDHAGQA